MTNWSNPDEVDRAILGVPLADPSFEQRVYRRGEPGSRVIVLILTKGPLMNDACWEEEDLSTREDPMSLVRQRKGHASAGLLRKADEPKKREHHP